MLRKSEKPFVDYVQLVRAGIRVCAFSPVLPVKDIEAEEELTSYQETGKRPNCQVATKFLELASQ